MAVVAARHSLEANGSLTKSPRCGLQARVPVYSSNLISRYYTFAGVTSAQPAAIKVNGTSILALLTMTATGVFSVRIDPDSLANGTSMLTLNQLAGVAAIAICMV